jgi:23S rRNA (uracil1939-C5)-methyltransferase
MASRRYTRVDSEERHTIRIEKLGFYGEGIGKSESGETYFVPLTAPGDLVVVQPTKRRSHFVEAEIIEVIEGSPLRVEPECKSFGKCGGCQLQHLSYQNQVEHKQKFLAHQIEKKLNTHMNVESYGSEQIYGYRRRVRMRQHQGEVGYFKRGTHSFLPIRHCTIAHDAINDWLANETNFPRPASIQDISIDSADGSEAKTYEGSDQRRMGFRQVNASGEATLQKLLKETLKESDQNLLELYAGEGALVLPWLKLHENQLYLGVDGDPVNIDSGRTKYGSDAVQFEVGQLPLWLIQREKIDSKFLSKFQTLVLDPPRSGLGEDLKKVQTLSNFKQIIYISCDVNSWTQDVRIFQEHAFKLSRVAMVDMFPQTRHFEIYSVLHRSS